jgi:hypothetical protein
MDPITLNLLLGLLTNAVWTMIHGTAAELGKRISEKATIQNTLARSVPLATLLQRVGAGLSHNGQVKDKAVAAFLASPDLDSVLRHLFLAPLSGSDFSVIDAKTEFSLVARSRIPHLTEEAADQVFGLLVEAAEITLQEAIGPGQSGAINALSQYRTRLLLSEVRAVKHHVEYLGQLQQYDPKTADAYESQYRGQALTRHKWIRPPAFDTARKYDIHELFVEPHLVTTDPQNPSKTTRIALGQLVESAHRAVILGNPGGGKSTLSAKLLVDVASGYPNFTVGGRRVTPVLVVLRDYGAARQSTRSSILRYLERCAESDYQLNPSPGTIEYLLNAGRLFIIFDGLDELLDTKDRQAISADVEAFAHLYSSVPILVTSREVGYEQAPLDHTVFATYRLSEFDDEQVEQYARKWFALDSDLSNTRRKEQTDAFLRESASVPDLRANPLMPSLMCNIYRGANYIPRNRPEVYQKCATMLFERWDRGRGIRPTLPFEEHIRPTMMFLAHRIYSDVELQKGATEDQLVRAASQYLCPSRFESTDEAESAARAFVEFCKGRAWVFTDTGSTREGERLFQFTHRTFLEYFTAGHLVRSHITPKDLFALLIGRIEAREWDMVAQLAVQIQNQSVEGAGEELVRLLLAGAEALGEAGGNRLSFAARSLEFLVPFPRTTKAIATSVVDCVCGVTAQSGVRRPDAWSGRAGMVADLFRAGAESYAIVESAFEQRLLEVISGNGPAAGIAAAIAMHLEHLHILQEGRGISGGPEARRAAELSRRLLKSSSAAIRRVGETDWAVARLLIDRGKMEVGEAIAKHGAKVLCLATPIVGTSAWYTELAYVFISRMVSSDEASKARQAIEQFGHALPELTLPWILGGELIDAHALAEYAELFTSGRLGADSKITGEVAAGVLAAAVVATEFAEQEDPERLSVLKSIVLDDREVDYGLALITILIARVERKHGRYCQEAFDVLNMPSLSRKIFEEWVGGRVTLVDRGDVKRDGELFESNQ